jgi:hypothetical protein
LDGRDGVVGHRRSVVGSWAHITPEKNPAGPLGKDIRGTIHRKVVGPGDPIDPLVASQSAPEGTV